ncbi:MAG: efflux RND transporter permease subunit, partial [Betaproteobacteria bacterium]
TLLPQLGTEFLPELNEGAVWVNVNYPSSVSVSEAQELSKRVRNAIRKFPEVVSVTSKAGRPEDGTDPKLINMAEFLVDLKPENEWQRGV